MPVVPNYQSNQVAPVETTRERLRPADNGGGVAGGLADGLIGLANAGSRYAEVQDRLQAENDDTQARALAAQTASQFSALEVEYSGLSAGAARSAQQEYMQRLEEARTAALEEAENPRMRRFLEERLTDAHRRTTANISRHAIQQQRVEREGVFRAETASYAERAANAADPAERDILIAEGIAVTHERLMEMEGIDPEANPEAYAMAALEFSSGVHYAQLGNMLAQPSPDIDAITAYLRGYEDEMTVAHKGQILASIQQPLQARSSRAGASLVMERLAGIMPTGEVAEAGEFAMPVEGTVPEGGRFTDARDGGARQHSALDISAPIGTPIYTIAPGRVTQVRPMDGASGNWVEVTHSDGSTSTYSHMNDFGVAVGDEVGAGHQLGTVGNTGAGTGPHLHLVMRDASGRRVDPEDRLGKPAPHVPAPREWDRAEVYRALEETAVEQGWSPEETERVRSEIDRNIANDESLYREQQADADEAAAEIILAQGENFTSTNMIPRDVWARMSVSQRASAEAVVERNTAPASVEPNSGTAISLSLMRYYEPERFKTLDISQYVGQVTPAELESAMVAQARMRTSGGGAEEGWTPRTGIVTALNYGKRMNPDLGLDDEDEAAILRIMEAQANAIYQQNGRVTDQEYADLFNNAIRERRITGGGFFSGVESKRTFELTLENMPAGVRDRLEAELRRQGLEVNDDNLLRLYRAMPRR